MASIIDSFRETFGDNMSVLKLLVFTVPTYYAYQLYIGAKGNLTSFYFVAVATLFFLFGFLIKTTGNVINERDSVLPSLNPFALAIASIKGILSIGPIAMVSCYVANWGCSFINIMPQVDITLKSIIWVIAAAVIATSFILFSETENILDGLRLKAISDKSGDLIMSLIIFLIQLSLINIPLVGFFGYTIWVLWGIGPIFEFFCAFAIVFNIAATGQYFAQVHYETFTHDKTGEKIQPATSLTK